ncbi:hypothetical protein RJ640_003111, partial [Escallonia rubra]
RKDDPISATNSLEEDVWVAQVASIKESCKRAKVINPSWGGNEDVKSYGAMIEVNASYNLDFCVVGEWRAIYTGIVAYRGTNPIGSEVVWIGVDHVFPCLEGKLFEVELEKDSLRPFE